MNLYAERTQTYLFKSFLNDLKSRHLFGNEKNSLTVCKSVRNHCGNRLGFTRTRRAMQDKALSGGSSLNSKKLRSVRRQRQHSAVLGNMRADGHFLCIPLQSTLDKAFYYLILFKLVASLTYVVPHNEL